MEKINCAFNDITLHVDSRYLNLFTYLMLRKFVEPLSTIGVLAGQSFKQRYIYRADSSFTLTKRAASFTENLFIFSHVKTEKHLQ